MSKRPDNTQEPRDLIQICTDIYYECETIKRLDELTDEALDWHNKRVEEAEKKAYQHAYMIMTEGDLTEVQALDCLLKLSGNAGLIFSEAERNKLKESK